MDTFIKNAQSIVWIGGVAIAGVLFVVNPINEMKTDIALINSAIANINSNHEVHIQDLTQDIKEIKLEQLDQQKQIVELQKLLIAITKK